MVKPQWIYDWIILVSTLVFFLLPMLIISVLYLLIGLRLHRERALTKSGDGRSSFGPESLSTANKQKLSRRNVQVTKMLCRCSFIQWHPQLCVASITPPPEMSNISPPSRAGVLVAVFGLCWAPFHVDRMMWKYMDNESYGYLHIISGVCFYLSSAVNPILYNIMSARFREMFAQITCRSKGHPAGPSLKMTQRSILRD